MTSYIILAFTNEYFRNTGIQIVQSHIGEVEVFNHLIEAKERAREIEALYPNWKCRVITMDEISE